MLSGSLFRSLINPNYRHFPGSRTALSENLSVDGGTMGTLFIGMQGRGKTIALARHILEKRRSYPDRAVFVLDWSGSITDALLSMMTEDELSKVVYDEMGHPDWCIPLPEFSHLYGSSYEEQAQRVARNMQRLYDTLMVGAPLLAGVGVKEIAPELFRLLTAITNNYGETWQITEAKHLLKDIAELRKARAKYGFSVPSADWYFKTAYEQVDPKERDLRTYSLIGILGAIETPTTKARIGYYRPAWTPREAIRDGLMVIVNGARLINQENTQHYLFTQVYSMIMEEINKRIPGDPKDKPVSLVLDEVYSLLSIPGMAQEIGRISPQYRSRKLELYIVLQALSQLSKELREQIWSLGNIVSFALSNADEAYEMAQQLFRYYPEKIKVQATTSTQLPLMEQDRGQYLLIANDIQRMLKRECIVRRYYSEGSFDKYIRWVPKTAEVTINNVNLFEVKEKLLAKRGVRVGDALETIRQRTEKEVKETTRPTIKK